VLVYFACRLPKQRIGTQQPKGPVSQDICGSFKPE